MKPQTKYLLRGIAGIFLLIVFTYYADWDSKIHTVVHLVFISIVLVMTILSFIKYYKSKQLS